MHFNRRMTASLIALATASAALAVGGASVGASSAQVPGVSNPCLDEVASAAPGQNGDETQTIGSLPLVGQALGGGLLGAGGSQDSYARTLECAGVDVPPDGFLINRIKIRPGG